MIEYFWWIVYPVGSRTPYQLFHYLTCNDVNNSILTLISAGLFLGGTLDGKHKIDDKNTSKFALEMSGNQGQIGLVLGTCFIPLRWEEFKTFVQFRKCQYVDIHNGYHINF